jgi:8-oxo-dGTP pyrophosphatase MutT (NUDIX family)
MAKKRVVRAFSAGGVVFRAVSAPSADGAARMTGEQPEQPMQGGWVEIALVGHVRENIWTLPKGTPAPNETREQTALREVREETGLESRIVAEVGQIEYTFTRRGMRFIKQVFHYLMLATGGSVEQHDHEYDEARWFAISDALLALTYDNEIEMVRRAEQLIHHYLATQP